MHVDSPVWPRGGKQASVFHLPESARASFSEEAMISLLNGFLAPGGLAKDGAVCCREKDGGVGRGGTFSGGAVILRESSDKHFDTFRSCVRPRFCYSLVFGSGGPTKQGGKWRHTECGAQKKREKKKETNSIKTLNLKIKIQAGN